jgi:hypothetical protein
MTEKKYMDSGAEPKKQYAMQSLSSKLKILRRGLKSKFRPLQLMGFEHIQLIARHMPRTEEALRKLIPESFVTAYGEAILETTIAHERDQDKFEDCIAEIDAFLRGGLPGMVALGRVYKNIIKHFGVEDDTEDVLDACRLYVHAEQGCLKCRRVVATEEDCV